LPFLHALTPGTLLKLTTGELHLVERVIETDDGLIQLHLSEGRKHWVTAPMAPQAQLQATVVAKRH
jgi:hypothetical protein